MEKSLRFFWFVGVIRRVDVHAESKRERPVILEATFLRTFGVELFLTLRL